MRSMLAGVCAFMFLFTAGAASAAVDLIVADIEQLPIDPLVGTGTLRIHFQNVGTDAVNLPFFEFTDYTIKIDGVLCEDSVLTIELEAGETEIVDTTMCNPGIAGSYDIEAVVDTEFDVSESNESNNLRVENFAWISPPPPVPSLAPLALAVLSTLLCLTAHRTLRA